MHLLSRPPLPKHVAIPPGFSVVDEFHLEDFNHAVQFIGNDCWLDETDDYHFGRIYPLIHTLGRYDQGDNAYMESETKELFVVAGGRVQWQNKGVHDVIGSRKRRWIALREATILEGERADLALFALELQVQLCTAYIAGDAKFEGGRIVSTLRNSKQHPGNIGCISDAEESAEFQKVQMYEPDNKVDVELLYRRLEIRLLADAQLLIDQAGWTCEDLFSGNDSEVKKRTQILVQKISSYMSEKSRRLKRRRVV